jgi:hypothetical protein
MISSIYNDGSSIASTNLIVDNGYANSISSYSDTSYENIALNGEFRLWKDASTPAMWIVNNSYNTSITCVPSSKTKNTVKCQIRAGNNSSRGIYFEQNYRPIPVNGINTITVGTLMKRYTITPGATNGGLMLKRYLYFYDKNNNSLGFGQTSNINWANGTSDNDNDWGYYRQALKLPAGTEFIRISWSVSSANDLTVEGGAYVSRFDVFLGSKSVIPSNRDFEMSVFRSNGNPSFGTFSTGDVIYENSPSGGGILTRQCTTTGTAGILNGGNTTGSISSGSNILTVNSLADLYLGCFINIAGETYQVSSINVTNKQVTLDKNSKVTFNNLAIAYSVPAFANIFGTTVKPLNYSSIISCDVTSGSVFTLTTTGDCIINAIGVNDGQKIVFVITNDATNGHAVKFGSNLKSNGALNGVVNKTSTIEFVCANGSWYEINRTTGL